MNMSQALSYANRIRFDSFIQRSRPQANAREIRIDQERVLIGFELKAVHAEISDADRIRFDLGEWIFIRRNE